MSIKFWNTASRTADPEALASLQAAGLSPLCARVLSARGVRSLEEIQSLYGEKDTLFDPFLLRDMDRAVERIRLAMESGELIVVYGDYDCDGVTSTALLYSYLEAVGANVIYYIPDREQEGYGLNTEAIDFLHNVRGIGLIITVDNGVSAHEEIAHANSLGIDVVVTDHHQPRETLPDAVAVVDPHRPDCPSPFKGLSGVGVAFKLVCALEGDDGYEMIEHYGDLAALGTIADVMPLTYDNRTLVRHGLELLADSARPGIRALVELAGLSGRPMTDVSAAFGLAPRINAAGRMGDVYDALELLLCEDEGTAREKAEILCGYNDQRKKIEAEILAEVAAKITADPSLVQERVIVMDGAGWHHGVVGILCSRLVEKYGRPAFLISTDDTEGRSSGRGIDGVSVIEAVSACGDLLTRYGGHAQAAGFTLLKENLPAFRERFLGYFREHYPIMPYYKLTADCVVEPSELTVPMVQSLSRLEPFGEGNPSPVFELDAVRLERIQSLSGGKHLKLACSKNGTAFQVLLFGTGPDGKRRVRADAHGGDYHVAIRLFAVRERHAGGHVPLPEDAARGNARQARHRMVGKRALQDPRPLVVEHGRQDARGEFEHEHLVYVVGKGLGRLQPDEARPYDHRAAFPPGPMGLFRRPPRLVPCPLRVVKGEEGMHVALALEPLDGRDEGGAAGGQQAFPVFHGIPSGKACHMAGGVDFHDLETGPEQRFDALVFVKARVLETHPFLGCLPLHQVRYERAAVGRVRVAVHDDDGGIGRMRPDALRRRDARRGVADDEIVCIAHGHASTPRFPRRRAHGWDRPRRSSARRAGPCRRRTGRTCRRPPCRRPPRRAPRRRGTGTRRCGTPRISADRTSPRPFAGLSAWRPKCTPRRISAARSGGSSPPGTAACRPRRVCGFAARGIPP